jgi:uncharacterized protein
MRFSVILFLLAVTVRSASPQTAVPEKLTDYQLEMQVKIPLRDGVRLNATLYKPSPMSGPLPVIFMLSPYPDATSHPSGSYFARRGYIYAYVDVRGRGDSEGVFNPLAQEANDGHDVVEWFAKQPWSNGKVAMFGGSYAGGDQWQTAATHPPHLVTIAPVASVRAGVDFPIYQNIPDTYSLQWLTYTTGHVLYEGVFSDGTLWSNAGKRLFLAKAPFNQWDKYSGNTGTVFQTWLKHPDFDDFWKPIAISREKIAGVNLPVLVLTGSHDGDQAGTLSYYKDHITSADPRTLENYYLVMGPWDHPGTREPKADFGGEHYGPASLIDVLRLHREWYDWTMKSGAKPAFMEKHVAYYVAGPKAECWKYADSLAAISSKSLTFYLDATGGAASIYHSGTLQPAAANAIGGSFLSDPNDLSAAEDRPQGQPGSDLHGDGLIFHSAPFAEDTEIDGRIDLRLSLSIDAPDTDLGYELHLITPDGKSHELTESYVRARYRNSLEHPEAIHENQPEEYHFDPGQWFAVRAPKGSQLRLIVSALNTLSLEKNWNSMKPVAEQSGADAHIAHIKLLQGPDHPSTLTLPLGDPSATCKASADW